MTQNVSVIVTCPAATCDTLTNSSSVPYFWGTPTIQNNSTLSTTCDWILIYCILHDMCLRGRYVYTKQNRRKIWLTKIIVKFYSLLKSEIEIKKLKLFHREAKRNTFSYAYRNDKCTWYFKELVEILSYSRRHSMFYLLFYNKVLDDSSVALLMSLTEKILSVLMLTELKTISELKSNFYFQLSVSYSDVTPPRVCLRAESVRSSYLGIKVEPRVWRNFFVTSWLWKLRSRSFVLSRKFK